VGLGLLKASALPFFHIRRHEKAGVLCKVLALSRTGIPRVIASSRGAVPTGVNVAQKVSGMQCS
jgi:hypothetical protein